MEDTTMEKKGSFSSKRNKKEKTNGMKRGKSLFVGGKRKKMNEKENQKKEDIRNWDNDDCFSKEEIKTRSRIITKKRHTHIEEDDFEKIDVHKRHVHNKKKGEQTREKGQKNEENPKKETRDKQKE